MRVKIWAGLALAAWASFLAAVVCAVLVTAWLLPVAVVLWIAALVWGSEAEREHRRNREDRRDSGSDQGAGFTTVAVGTGTSTGGSLIARTVVSPPATIRSGHTFTATFPVGPGQTSAGPLIVTGQSDPRPRLIAEAGDEPIRAWKYASIVGGRPAEDGSVRFKAQSVEETYGVVETARCTLGHKHRAPDEDCTCGFYARDRELAPEPGGHVVLEVELYGKVLIGSNGYRAEKQRVLSITAPAPRCHTLMDTDDGTRYCNQPAQYVDKRNDCLCALHAVESRHRFWPWSPEPINCQTDWRWG